MATDIPDCVGIIPARYASKRFPGKPLADILGKPMFWHVFERARRCPELKQVVLATDDERILAAARQHGVPAVMTRADHPSGSDRVMEAVDLLDVNPQAVVVNIQGDEPLLAPRMLSELVAPFADPQVLVTTLAQPMAEADTLNPDRVKVVCSLSGRALYFSRAPLPARADDTSLTVLGHIGLYAFRLPCLREFVSWPPSPLERTERLEQLRLLEHDIPVHVVLTDQGSRSVDRPEDLEAVRQQLLQTTKV